MPYLPTDTIDHTNFPQAFSKDFFMQVRLIEGQWVRFFPQVEYECIKKDVEPPDDPAVSPVVEPDPNVPIGGAGATQFDPIYGESVDGSMKTTGWEQPHLSATVPDTGTHKATEVEIYEPKIDLHARVQTREDFDLEAKPHGFDRVRDIILTIPLSILDDKGITVKHGDRFRWDDDLYMVLQFERIGFWKNTNLRLYIALNCEHFRPGA